MIYFSVMSICIDQWRKLYTQPGSAAVEWNYPIIDYPLFYIIELPSLAGVLSVPLRLSAPSPPSSMFDVSGESEIITPGCHTNHTNVSRSVTQTLVLAVTALQWEGRVRISGQIRTQECFT